MRACVCVCGGGGGGEGGGAGKGESVYKLGEGRSGSLGGGGCYWPFSVFCFVYLFIFFRGYFQI